MVMLLYVVWYRAEKSKNPPKSILKRASGICAEWTGKDSLVNSIDNLL